MELQNNNLSKSNKNFKRKKHHFDFCHMQKSFFYEMHKMVVFQKRICLLSINVFVYVQSIIKDRKIFLTG